MNIVDKLNDSLKHQLLEFGPEFVKKFLANFASILNDEIVI